MAWYKGLEVCPVQGLNLVCNSDDAVSCPVGNDHVSYLHECIPTLQFISEWPHVKSVRSASARRGDVPRGVLGSPLHFASRLFLHLKCICCWGFLCFQGSLRSFGGCAVRFPADALAGNSGLQPGPGGGGERADAARAQRTHSGARCHVSGAQVHVENNDRLVDGGESTNSARLGGNVLWFHFSHFILFLHFLSLGIGERSGHQFFI